MNLSFGSFVRDAGQYVVWVIMSVYLNEVRSLSYIGVGLVFLVGGILSVPVSYIGGNLMDRIGRRKIVLFTTFSLSAISFILFLLLYFNSAILPIVALFVVAGPLQSLEYVAINTILSDVTSESERLAGFSALRVAANLGIGIGLVSGGLVSQLNYAYVFILPFVGYLVEGVLYYFKIPETLKPSVEAAGIPGETHRGTSMPYRDTFFILISLIVAFSWFFTGMFESALTPLYMSSVNHFSPISITVLFAINSVVVITLQRPINRLLIKMRDSIRIIMGLLLYAVAFLVFAEFSIYAVVSIAVIILTIGENIQSPASNALITKMAPEKNRGSYLGFNSSIDSVINPFRPLVGTFLLAAASSQANLSWIWLSVVCVGIAIIFMILFRRISIRRSKLGYANI